MSFPTVRMRRLRENPTIRDLVQETRLSIKDFIYPVFAVHGKGIRKEIPSMPGCFHFSVDELAKESREIARLGIPAIIIFGLPSEKDPTGREAYAKNGIVQQAVRAVKKASPDLAIVTDVCLCEYTDHGHCGVIVNGKVDNDKTLGLLGSIALSHAQAGADMVAPSDMMDGRVAAIRQTLDKAGKTSVPIMAYSAKYASAFFGPFREAAESAPQFGDRKSYQMDPADANQAMREIQLDIEEGADIVMVKPALPYLDIIARAKERFSVPVAAYNVSGEYSMLKAASAKGWLNERNATLESLTAIKRAGADIIISYHAKQLAKWLKEDH